MAVLGARRRARLLPALAAVLLLLSGWCGTSAGSRALRGASVGEKTSSAVARLNACSGLPGGRHPAGGAWSDNCELAVATPGGACGAECALNYEPSAAEGAPVSRCQPDGTWGSVTGKCVRAPARLPVRLPNGGAGVRVAATGYDGKTNERVFIIWDSAAGEWVPQSVDLADEGMAVVDVAFVNSTFAWGVGTHEGILQWDGRSQWTTVHRNLGGKQYDSVAAAGPHAAWAVGPDPAAFRHFNGQRWARKPAPALPQGFESLYIETVSVAATPQGDAYVVGLNSPVADAAALLRWDGKQQAWALAGVLPGKRLWGVSALPGGGDVWLSGSTAATWTAGGGAGGGKAGFTVMPLDRAPDNPYMYSIAAADKAHVWTCGHVSGGDVIQGYDGASWRLQSEQFDASDVAAVGPAAAVVAGWHGLAWWDGARWARQPGVPDTYQLSSVSVWVGA